MSRQNAIARAAAYFDEGRFFEELSRRVAIPSESENEDRVGEIAAYLTEEMTPSLERLGFECRLLPNQESERTPFLFAQRIEDLDRPTVLIYGHGDVVRGLNENWRQGLSPWRLQKEGERWYGRGAADNKGQHTINIGALAAVLAERGSLGFNPKILIEMGEEIGSPGLHGMCEQEKDLLAADVLIASEGPRLSPDRPTIFTGNRGMVNFDMAVDLREGGHHSGNWGGLLANPAVILAHALVSIVGRHGQILVPEIRPDGIPEAVRRALADIAVTDQGEPQIDPNWGEPELSLAEKVYGWNTFEVLSFITGNPENPVNAIPPRAVAHCQIRFVVGKDPHQFLPDLRRHLDEHGFHEVKISLAHKGIFQATRVASENPWVRWGAESIERSSGQRPVVLPNVGGSLPNDAFTDILGMPTLWVPHSYPGCSQHAPNEHLLEMIAREGLKIMTGLFWDLGGTTFRCECHSIDGSAR